MSERSLADLPAEKRREAIKEGFATISECVARFRKPGKDELWALVSSGRIPVRRVGKRGRGAGTVLVPVALLIDHINDELGASAEARG